MSSCVLNELEFFPRVPWKLSDKFLSLAFKAFSNLLFNIIISSLNSFLHSGQVLSSFWAFVYAVPVSI